MKNGDIVYIYHTGKVRAIVGIAKVVKEGEIPMFEFVSTLKTPITLSEVKQRKEFSELKLVRQSRLSVMNVPPILQDYIKSKN